MKVELEQMLKAAKCENIVGNHWKSRFMGILDMENVETEEDFLWIIYEAGKRDQKAAIRKELGL